MALLTKEATVKWSGKTRSHYKSKGYIYTGHNKEFIVKIDDLTEGCPVRIDVACDICGETKNLEYRKYIKNTKRNNEYQCNKCGHGKPTKEQLVTMFTEAGYELLSEYTSSSDKLWFLCPVHGEMDISYANFSQGRRCRKCGTDKIRIPYKDVKKAFEDKGYTLLSNKYTDNKQLLEYLCSNHPDKISKIKYNDLQQGHGCPYCKNDAISERQKGENHYGWTGKSELNNWLRSLLLSWKSDSLKEANYLCDVTGKNGIFQIHHSYPFNKIVNDTLEDLGLEVKPEVGEYTTNERDIIETNFIKKHYEHGLGKVILEPVHKLFHHIYGKCNTTPEQYDEFKARYQAGEFNG